jgi:hypothetical protein
MPGSTEFIPFGRQLHRIHDKPEKDRSTTLIAGLPATYADHRGRFRVPRCSRCVPICPIALA